MHDSVSTPDPDPPQSSIVLYPTEGGRTRMQCRLEAETNGLTQALIAEPFQKDVRTINEHLVNVFEEGELTREAPIRKFRIGRREAACGVAREIERYSLPAILAVVYRVRSPRGTQFREWATARWSDGERLKNTLVKGTRTTSTSCSSVSATSARASGVCAHSEVPLPAPRGRLTRPG